jgi:hypothetical protein
VRHAGDRRSRLSDRLAGTAGVLLAFVALALAFAPVPAQAYESYQHGGIDDCETCHVNAHTWWTPTNEHCLTCHTGYQVVDSRRLCWTCHTPGQDMAWARTDAGCTSTCHLRGGAAFAHAAHSGGSTACTTCHPVSTSPSDPSGSAHHVVPAPRLDAVAPTTAAPGATVMLTGRRFSWAAIVRFGGAKADFTIASDERIAAVVPAAAVSGPVTVLSPGGTATSNADFVVLRPVDTTLTLRATPAVFGLGRRVRLAGMLTPADSGGLPVTIAVQRRQAGVWKAATSASRAPDATGAYAWSYRPRQAGAYRARASFPAAGVRSSWAVFRVR